jgi:hypothetical protein
MIQGRRPLLLTVLLLAGTALHAESERPSRPLWEKRIVHAPAVAPVLSGDTLWVVGSEKRIHSISAIDGKRHWRKNLPGPAVLPVAPDGDLLYLGLGWPVRMLEVLDRKSGHERWTARLDGIPVGLASQNGKVIVVTSDGAIQVFARTDGSPLWHRRLGRQVAGVVLAEGRLCVLAREDSLWCFNPGDGALRWAVLTWGKYTAAPIAPDSLLVTAAYDGEIVVRRIDDGVEIARAVTPSPRIAPPVAIAGAIVLVATGGEIESLRLPSLERDWLRETGETVSCPVLAWGEWWIVPALSGRLLALTRVKGIDAWDLKLPSSVFLPPAASKEYLAIVDERGRALVYRFGGTP